MNFSQKKILNSFLYAKDIVIEVTKYIQEMDSYYDNQVNSYKDKESYIIYSNFKEKCIKLAKDRGVIH